VKGVGSNPDGEVDHFVPRRPEPTCLTSKRRKNRFEQNEHAKITNLTILGRYPTGSGVRTVVASLPLAPPSGRRRGPPRRASRHPPHHEALPPCAHSLFEPRFESPTRRPKAPSGISQWDLRSSHWEVAAFPVGKVQAPTGKSPGRSPPLQPRVRRRSSARR
jgi:hypothetical protein